MEKLNEQALLQVSETAFRAAIIRKVNQLIDEVTTGTVWENKVQAERDTDGVYSALPLNTKAEMIEEEYQKIMKEMGLTPERTQNEQN